MDEEYLKVDEIARLFKVTKATVRTWIHLRKFPNAFKMGDTEQASWRVPKSDVKAFAQKEYGS